MDLSNFITDLLHINDVERNSLLDIGAKPSKTFSLTKPKTPDLGEYVVSLYKRYVGKTASVCLKDSALSQEQIVGKSVRALEWTDGNGQRDASALDKFIADVYKTILQKGNNPLFLGVGTVTWKLAGRKDGTVTAQTPLLVYPVRLVRSVSTAPVMIEFINDDVYLNPCFCAMLERIAPNVFEKFPHPNGEGISLDVPVDIEALADGKAYFERLNAFVASDINSEEALFEFDKNVAVIAPYEHNELCMYYDIRRNRKRIDAHPLVNRIFEKSQREPEAELTVEPKFVLARDTAQERIVRRAVNGESLIVKGPPGTGKTHTIVNLIAALIASGKKVLLSSAKLSALSEVYLQMPDGLRDFCMLLEADTESATARLDPSNVKKDLADLVNKRRELLPIASEVDEDIRIAASVKRESMQEIDNYIAAVFGSRDVLGMTYYDALDRLCEFRGEAVEFVKSSDALALGAEAFHDTARKAHILGELLKTLTAEGAYPYEKCPWTPSGESAKAAFAACDKEVAIRVFSQIKADADSVRERTEAAAAAVGISPDGIKLSAAIGVSDGELDASGISAVLDKCTDDVLGTVSAALDVCREADSVIMFPDGNGIGPYENFVADRHIDNALTLGEADMIARHIEIFDGIKDADDIKRLFAYEKDIEKSRAELSAAMSDIKRVFALDTSADDFVKIDKLCTKLQKYRGETEFKPDFSSSRVYKKLCKFSYIDAPEFADVVKAALARLDYVAVDAEIRSAEKRICQLFGRRLDRDVLDCLYTLYRRCAVTKIGFEEYSRTFRAEYKTLSACLEKTSVSPSCTIKDVADAAYAKLMRHRLSTALAPLFENTVLAVTDGTAVALGEYVCALKEMQRVVGDSRDAADTILAFASAFADVRADAAELLDTFRAFSKQFFPFYYGNDTESVTASDLKIFVAGATDRTLLNASIEFASIADGGSAVSLEKFFEPFVTGRREFDGSTDFKEIFECSMLFAAADAKTRSFGDWKNGTGARTARALCEFAEAERKQCDATVKRIAFDLLYAIDPRDRDFDFLGSDKGFDTTLRRLFKNHARELLKLKKCFMLSASTASVLFNSDEFSAFDTVIIDEASQLEPVCALPVISRAKQVVLVGDEQQMPPIMHFGSRDEKELDDGSGETVVMSPDLSVLELALCNEAFDIEALDCHFRSRTEALIAFSQQRYYPYMRTFPSAVPRAEGLGFRDVYVEDGACKDGVNIKEARAVIEELERHFDNYYRDGVLTESVGVVAFGVAQIEYIRDRVAKNKSLSNKIAKALAAYDDMPEKLIFFKTIETVQGQETDHLILSITYGRTKDGKITQSYGELNRGDIGQRIFNVAVTRAKSSVTVVHSTLPSDITGDGVRYIGEYIDTAAKFAVAQNSVFSSHSVSAAHGFIARVADFVCSLGIDRERIVFDCGVTDGSVRVPIAILSKDLKSAELGLWCETAPGASPYVDENGRYFDMLVSRGWKLHRIYLCDWIYNAEAERTRLKNAIAHSVEK